MFRGSALVGSTREQCKVPTRPGRAGSQTTKIKRDGTWSGYTNDTEVGARKSNKGSLLANQRKKLGFKMGFFVGLEPGCAAQYHKTRLSSGCKKMDQL